MSESNSAAPSGSSADESSHAVGPDFSVKSYALINQPDLLFGVIRYKDDRIAIVQPIYSPAKIGFLFRFAGERRHYATGNPVLNIPPQLREELYTVVVALELGRLKSIGEPAQLTVSVDPKQLQYDGGWLEILLSTLRPSNYPRAKTSDLSRLRDLLRRLLKGLP